MNEGGSYSQNSSFWYCTYMNEIFKIVIKCKKLIQDIQKLSTKPCIERKVFWDSGLHYAFLRNIDKRPNEGNGTES